MKVDIVEIVDSDLSPNSNDHLLVRELTHRINNEFTSIIGHTSLMAARSSNAEVKDALSGITRLLHHCADVHRALQMPSLSTLIDASSYIRALCQSIRRARLENRDIELVLVEYPIQMRSDQCWRLGMIVSELITNSMRHAFDGRGGTIRVELSSSGPYVECCVMDNGSSRECREPGQGLRIVEALAKELDGNAIYWFGPKGAFSVVIFPIDSSPACRRTQRSARSRSDSASTGDHQSGHERRRGDAGEHGTTMLGCESTPAKTRKIRSSLP